MEEGNVQTWGVGSAGLLSQTLFLSKEPLESLLVNLLQNVKVMYETEVRAFGAGARRGRVSELDGMIELLKNRQASQVEISDKG